MGRNAREISWLSNQVFKGVENCERLHSSALWIGLCRSKPLLTVYVEVTDDDNFSRGKLRNNIIDFSERKSKSSLNELSEGER